MGAGAICVAAALMVRDGLVPYVIAAAVVAVLGGLLIEALAGR
jgi:hypothetical protein